MPLPYDPAYTAHHYDEYGDREWGRHDASMAARASHAIHRAFLAEHVHSGDVVLDAGAGPGVFTIALAELGATVHVGDISSVQLAANAARVATAGWEHAVRSRTVLDICDLSAFEDDTFDVALCFGGPISYTLDRAPDAVRELCRVTRPAGHVLVSVMSTLGSLRYFLPGVFDVGRRFGSACNDEIVTTGDLRHGINDGHECHMYRWTELAALLEPHGEVVAASASNFLTAQPDALFESCTDDELGQLLRWEHELCREPGALDGGTHILAALRVN